MTTPRTPFGFLNIDKPSGMTSHDVVNRVRRKFGIRKVGHAGTLDPLATGVLVICLGDATRLSEYAMSTQKVYDARIHLGVETTTYDSEGEVIHIRDAAAISLGQVEALVPEFTGVIDQLPPVYSAIKKDGRKLYEFARAGEDVVVEPRQVEIFDLEVCNWELPEFVLRVTCGAGTYIRSLAHDLGMALGVGAYLSGLCRVRSGSFSISSAVTLDQLMGSEDPQAFILPPDFALQDMLPVRLDHDQVSAIRQGRPVECGSVSGDIGRAYAPDGRLIALVRFDGKFVRPHKVFASQFDVS